MPRQVRIQYAGAYYHVMARGDRREAIFLGDEDRELFLDTLGAVCAKTGWRVHAWVLMSNHYHWVVETPEANLVSGMQWFQNTYTRRFNQRHGLWGHVFGSRYKAVVVEESRGPAAGDYLAGLLDYVHLNPVRVGLVRPGKGKGLLDYAWSSLAQGYAVRAERRRQWMEMSVGLELAGRKDTVAGRKRFVQRLEERAREEGAKRCGWVEKEGQTLNSTLARGWYWGSEMFRERLLHLLARSPAKTNRNYQSSRQGRDHASACARRILAEGKAALGLTAAEIQRVPGSDARKVALAHVLHTQTTIPQRWIAERLKMGSAANVSQQVRRFSRTPVKKRSPEVKSWLDSVKNC